MSKPIIIVTGSSGLIGEAVVRRLASEFEIVGLDVRAPQADSPVDFVEFDVTDDRSVDNALSYAAQSYGETVASVIHLAAYYDFSGEPSSRYEEITIEGTRRLLRKLERMDVEQFLFSSTLLVHEPSEPGRPINESSPLHPKWDYPRSKAATEKIVRDEHGDIPYVILRIAGVYDDWGHSIPIANQIKRIYEKDLTGRVYAGDLTHGQAYLHLEDLVDAIAACVDRRRDAGVRDEVFLVGEPDTCSYDEMQQIIGRAIHGDAWETIEIPKPLAKLGAWVQEKAPAGEDPFIKPWMVDLADDHYELDIGKAEERLGWKPRHRLNQTLHRIVEHLKANPARWYEENDLDMPEALEETTRH